jgi:hypothetical protein
MGRILGLVALTIAMLASTAVAQSQGSEITAGYTFMSADGGIDRLNMNGWHTGGSIFLNEWLFVGRADQIPNAGDFLGFCM